MGLIAAAAGCNDANKEPIPPAPTARREALTASGTATATAAPSPTVSHRVAPPAAPRTLCSGAPLDRAMPTEKLGHAQAPGAPELGSAIAVGHGKWTWINLWAAWCGPCKEELPRLQQWQAKLAANATFQFVSLDDDERQLLMFLEGQPASGLKTTFWLPEGKTRDGWLSGLKINTSPELPVQILVNPQGRVHCIIEGAVEDGDFARVASILAQR